MSIEPMVANAPPGPAQDSRTVAGRVARPSQVGRSAISLKVVSSRATEQSLSAGMQEPDPESAAGGRPEANAWLTVPRGIAFGVLLAIPFWVILAALAVWLLR